MKNDNAAKVRVRAQVSDFYHKQCLYVDGRAVLCGLSNHELKRLAVELRRALGRPQVA